MQKQIKEKGEEEQRKVLLTSNSFFSNSLVLNFFCTSLIRLNTFVKLTPDPPCTDARKDLDQPSQNYLQ